MAGAASKKSTHPLRFWRCFVLKVTMCLSRWDTGADRVGAHTSGVKQRSVTALLDTTLPQIPGRKVKELFRRFANKVVAGSNKVSLPTVPRRSLNAKLATSSKGNEFMENMMQAEMAACSLWKDLQARRYSRPFTPTRVSTAGFLSGYRRNLANCLGRANGNFSPPAKCHWTERVRSRRFRKGKSVGCWPRPPRSGSTNWRSKILACPQDPSQRLPCQWSVCAPRA